MPSLFPFRNISAVKFIYGVVSRNSSRVDFKKPKKGIYKRTISHPKLFEPHHCDNGCGFCGGLGCGRCPD